MDVRVTEVSKGKVELTLEKEDFSISDILHQELLKNPKIVFAGIAPPHPLLKKYMMKLQTAKNTDPISVLAASSKDALETAAEILEAVEKAFQGREG